MGIAEATAEKRKRALGPRADEPPFGRILGIMGERRPEVSDSGSRDWEITTHMKQASGMTGHEQAIRGDLAAPCAIGNVGFRDIRHIHAIQQASFRPGLAYSRGALLTLWLLPNVTFLVARNASTGEAIGCIIGDRYQGGVRIMNLAIHPEWRRQGIATHLLRAIAERLPDGDISLMVEEFNRSAQALYVREGFVRIGFRPDYYGPKRNGIHMVLRRREPTTRNGKPTSGQITT
jgi:[ribosomal protein S18]-alanine N-acetyltransferase